MKNPPQPSENLADVTGDDEHHSDEPTEPSKVRGRAVTRHVNQRSPPDKVECTRVGEVKLSELRPLTEHRGDSGKAGDSCTR